MAKIERYDVNPFTTEMVIPKRGKYVQLSRLGRDQNVLINTDTGEHFGTHVTTVKTVDSEQFIKLFTSHIALTLSYPRQASRLLMSWFGRFKETE